MSKKNIIGLSMLLLVLLLGLFTTSYASFTESEIKNLYYNGLRQLGGKTEQQAKDLVDIVDFSNLMKYGNNSQYVNLSGYFNNDSYTYYCFYYNGGNNSKYLYVYVCSTNQYVRSNETASQNKKITNSNISALMEFYVANPNPSPNVRARGRVGGQNLSQTWTECYSPVKPITYYNNDNNIIWSAPIQTSNWLTPSGPYSDWEPTWEFVPFDDNYSFKVFYPNNDYIVCYPVTKSYSMTDIGYLVNSNYVTSLWVQVDAYDYDTGFFETVIDLYKVWDRDMGSITDYYNTQFISDGDSSIWQSFIRYNSNYIGNNFIIHFVAFADRVAYEDILEPAGLPASLQLDIYTSDSHTAYSGEYIDFSNTFTDDYKDDYTNQINNSISNFNNSVDNDKIIGSIANIQDGLTDSSAADDFIDNTLSGDYESLANQFGYDPVENGYENFIFSLWEDIETALANEGNPYIEIPLRDGTIKRIYASDFTVPNGLIKAFVSGTLVVFTFILIYQYLSKVIIAINEGDPKKFLDLLGVDHDLLKF